MQVNIFPRPRRSLEQPPVVVTRDVLESFAHIPQYRAAKLMGVSITALKSACRKLGVSRWPVKRSVCKKAETCRVVDIDVLQNEQDMQNCDDSQQDLQHDFAPDSFLNPHVWEQF